MQGISEKIYRVKYRTMINNLYLKGRKVYENMANTVYDTDVVYMSLSKIRLLIVNEDDERFQKIYI